MMRSMREELNVDSGSITSPDQNSMSTWQMLYEMQVGGNVMSSWTMR